MSDSEPDSDLENDFKKATKLAKKFANSDKKTLAFLYGHYKQATVGDCDMSKPSSWDFMGNSKYAAWNELKGMSKDEAKKKYIKKMKRLKKGEK